MSIVVPEWMTALALLVSVLLIGLVAGIFLATQLGQVRFQKTLNARDFTLVKHGFEVAVGGVMPPLVIAAGASTIPVIAVVWSQPLRLGLAVATLLLWTAVIAVTLVYNAPVNRLAARWDPSTPPADWLALRDRWHRGQTIRTPFALAAFATVALNAVLHPGPGT
jgi:uncharacterized membrane protein